jgi:hypothetical protein
MYLNSQNIIIPQPTIDRDIAPAPLKLVPIFDLLRHPVRASLVANIRDDAENFSRPVALSDVAEHFYIKAPGTDFYLPGKLAQCSGAMEKIILHQYSENNSASPNRTGAEYCNISFYQQNQVPSPSHAPGPFNHHIDMMVAAALEQGFVEYIDRYIVPDCLPTWFFDFALDMDPGELRTRAKNEPDYVGEFIRARGPGRQFNALDIVHFGNTTPHALDNPVRVTPRTMMIVSFTQKPPAAAAEFTHHTLAEADRRHRRLYESPAPM